MSAKICTSLISFLCHVFSTNVGNLANIVNSGNVSFTAKIVEKLINNGLVTYLPDQFYGLGTSTEQMKDAKYPKLPMLIYRKYLSDGFPVTAFVPMEYVSIEPTYLVE